MDDPITVDQEANGRPLAGTARVPEQLMHGATVNEPEERSTPESEPSYVILVSQVGAVPAFGNASVGRRLPFT
jgi:hypothetical protein